MDLRSQGGLKFQIYLCAEILRVFFVRTVIAIELFRTSIYKFSQASNSIRRITSAPIGFRWIIGGVEKPRLQKKQMNYVIKEIESRAISVAETRRSV